MYNCEEIKILIDRYIDRQLIDSEKADLNKHLETCPECREEFEAKTAIAAMLAETADEELPEGFEQQLHEKLSKVKPDPVRKYAAFFGSGYFKAISGIAAGILILVFVFTSGSFFRMGGISQGPIIDNSTTDTSNKENKPDPGITKDGSNYNGNSTPSSADPNIIAVETAVPQPSDSGGMFNNSQKGATPGPTEDNSNSLNYATAELNIKSSDFVGDYQKIAAVASQFSAVVNKNYDASHLDTRILKEQYDDFLSKIKTSLGAANITEAGMSEPGNDGSGETGNEEYIVVEMNLEV